MHFLVHKLYTLKLLLSLSNFINNLNERIGNVFSWTVLILIIIICLDVGARYFFKISFLWVIELQVYFFTLCILLGAGYTFKHDQHVRVDLFYSNWSKKAKAKSNLIGGLLFLIPWCIVILIVSFKYALRSFKIAESSPQAGGLPALYLLKFIIFFAFVFLFLQGIASVLKSIKEISTEEKES